MLPTRRITRANNDTSFYMMNDTTVSAGLLDTIYCTNVTQQLCMQANQSLSGVDQKVSAILIAIAATWFVNKSDFKLLPTLSKPCRIEGCYDLTEPKRPYCARHCGNRQCEKGGCNKCAQG